MAKSRHNLDDLNQTCKMYGVSTVDDTGKPIKRLTALKKMLEQHFNVEWVRIAAHSCTL